MKHRNDNLSPGPVVRELVPSTHQRSEQSSALSKDNVTKLCKGLNPSKALGPDELHPRVLKEPVTELGQAFAPLFQHSTDTREIPKEWSLANICLLFKKSDRSLVCYYRRVSLACVPCKLLEHIVYVLLRKTIEGYYNSIIFFFSFKKIFTNNSMHAFNSTIYL